MEKRENGKKGLENKLGSEALEAYLKYLNKLQWRTNLQFVNDKEYKIYKQLYKSQVLSVSKETLDAWSESGKFREFTEFFDVAKSFDDTETMEEIVKVCKKIFTADDDQEQALSLENKLAEYKTKSEEDAKKITDLENIAKKGSKEELEKVVKWLFVNEKYNRPDLLMTICERYIKEFKGGTPDQTEILLNAWKGMIVNTAKLKSIEEAKKSFETLKEKAADFKDNNAVFEKSVREITLDLKNLQNDYNSYLKNIKNTDPMIGVLENYAGIYKENYQFTEEAYTRKQLIDLYKLDSDKEAIQLYLLSMSYYNLGYFDNVKKTAEYLKEKYPSSTYSESISSILNFMPK